jgi:hypothetical protein
MSVPAIAASSGTSSHPPAARHPIARLTPVAADGDHPRALGLVGLGILEDFRKGLAGALLQLLYRDEIAIQLFLGRLGRVRDDPGHDAILPANDELPIGVGRLDAVRQDRRI